MKEKESLFVRYYLQTGNPREAAARAGYRLCPERWGLKLLRREGVQAAIEAEGKHLPAAESAKGLTRLAFGSVADGISLMFRETPPTAEELEAMDLFMVSEIKRPKGGGLEIKFFDRLKALQLLQEMGGTGQNDRALPFYKALQEGALRLSGEEV